jgi:hypothetical protein
MGWAALWAAFSKTHLVTLQKVTLGCRDLVHDCLMHM